MTKKIAVIGGGFAGISSACSLARMGFDVTLLEKNATTGGRARSFSAEGFTFDMGPSWYWMPDVFEKFFSRFGKRVEDYYDLVRLDPSYRVFFEGNRVFDVPASYAELKSKLEELEPGCGPSLDKFISEARRKYEVSMGEFVWKPSLSFREFMKLSLFRDAAGLHLFSSFRKHARRYFTHPDILRLLEFPVLFLGADPSRIPAMYSLMNYADICLGTWYPKGGMLKIAEGMTKLATELGVRINTSAEVSEITVADKRAKSIRSGNQEVMFDAIVATADYHHVDQQLLSPVHRDYTEGYWKKRTMSPSSLIFYLGINKKLEGLLHHNLFFDENFDVHSEDIYEKGQWPGEPLFYACCPSKTDSSVAPAGKENLFILIPVAVGLESDKVLREKYLAICLERIKVNTGEDIAGHIEFMRSYAHEEFISDYNSFQGNAYGLANTLMQTAMFKPRMRSNKVENLFYAGQLTVPGPGVPPSIISGQLAAEQVDNYFNKA